MKIVYITNDSSVTMTKNGYSGVMKKVISQISEVHALGMELELLILNENLPVSLRKEIDIRFKKAKAAPYKNFWEKITGAIDFSEAVLEEINQSDGSTVLYIRGLLPTPRMISVLCCEEDESV